MSKMSCGMLFEDDQRQLEVISTPRVMETDEGFDDFFKDLNLQQAPVATMSVQQPPQQPAIDIVQPAYLPVFSDGHDYPGQYDVDDITKIVVKQEANTGFLETWFQHAQQPSTDDSSMSAGSPYDEKRMESSLIKEEISCRIQLKLLQQGRDYSREVDSRPKEYTVSAETLELQRVRREKNREAAKKCRQKKKVGEKQKEQKLRDAEREVQEMRRQLDDEKRKYASLLNTFQAFPCFMSYLKHNRDVLKSPLLKSILQTYAKEQRAQGNTSDVKPCSSGCAIEQ